MINKKNNQQWIDKNNDEVNVQSKSESVELKTDPSVKKVTKLKKYLDGDNVPHSTKPMFNFYKGKKEKKHFYSTWSWWLKLLILFILLLCFLLLFRLTNLEAWVFAIVLALAPLFLGVFFAWLLNPIVILLNKKLKINFFVAKQLVFVFAILIFYTLIGILFYYLVLQLVNFISLALGDQSAISALIKALDGLQDKTLALNKYLYANNVLELFFSNGTTLSIKGNFGAFYIFIFKITVWLHSFINVESLATILNYFYTHTSGSGLLNIGVVIVNVLWRFLLIVLFTTFILFFTLSRYGSLVGFLKINLPFQTKAQRDKFGKVFNFALVAWTKGLTVDVTFLFAIVLIFLILAGYVGNDTIFKVSFLLFSTFFAICSIVPIYGVIVGAIPILINCIIGFSLYNNYLPLILALTGVVIAVAIEAIFISPLIYSKTSSLHPITILIGLSVFWVTFGFWSTLFTVPILAIIKLTAKEFYGINLKI